MVKLRLKKKLKRKRRRRRAKRRRKIKNLKKTKVIKDAPNEHSRISFDASITELSERLEKQRKINEDLLKEYRFAELELSELEENKESLLTYLEDIVAAQKDQEDKLQSVLLQLHEEAGVKKEIQRKELETLKIKWEKDLKEVSTDLLLQQGRLGSLEECRIQRKSLENQLCKLGREEVEQERKHAFYYLNLESEKLLESHRFMKETDERLQALSSEIQQLSEIGSKSESVKLAGQLSTLYKQLDKIKSRLNNHLRDKNSQEAKLATLILDIEIVKDTNAHLTKKNGILKLKLEKKMFEYQAQLTRLGESKLLQDKTIHNLKCEDLLSQQLAVLKSEIQRVEDDITLTNTETNCLKREQKTLLMTKSELEGKSQKITDAINRATLRESLNEGEVIIRRQELIQQLLNMII